MTYNPYTNYGYQTPCYTPQYAPQAAMQNIPAQQMFSAQNAAIPVQPALSSAPTQASVAPSPSTIIWVNGEKEAAMYPVAQNSAVALWDSANPVIFLKQADATGRQTMKTFDLVERVEKTESAQAAPEIDLSAYAAKSDVNMLVEALGAMKRDIDSIKKELENQASQAVKRALGAKPISLSEGDDR